MSEARDMVLEAESRPKRRSFFVDLLTRLIKEKPLGTGGGVVIVVMVLIAILANILAPYGMNETNLVDRLSPPSANYILGTDNLGRDLLTRVIFGARISVTVALAATTLSVLISVVLGILCGYMGGKFDIVVQRFVDAWMSFPPLLILITVVSIIGPGLWQVIIVLGAQFGIAGSRIVRSAVIAIKENLYVNAAVAIGCPTWKLLIRHIMPNIMAPVIILFSTRVGAVILAEATMSFLGFGIPPPYPSWGGMLSGAGRKYMILGPWIAIWPGLALSFTVFSVNMLGDAVRDLLDPRLRGGVGRYGIMTKKLRDKKSR